MESKQIYLPVNTQQKSIMERVKRGKKIEEAGCLLDR